MADSKKLTEQDRNELAREADIQERIRNTKEAILGSRGAYVGIKTAQGAKSLLTQAQAAANWWQRLVAAYVGTLQDPELPGLTSLDKTSKSIKLFEKYYDSDFAKQHRFHTLDMFDAMGRMAYTAAYLGKEAFEYPEQTGFALGNYMLGDKSQLGGKPLVFRNMGLLDRVRAIANSYDAGKFVNDHGELFVDLPVGIMIDMANPLFHAVSRVPEWNQFKHREKVFDLFKKDMTPSALGDLLDKHFEGGDLEKGLEEAVHHALSNGDRDTAHRILHLADFRKPSIFSEFDLDYFRPAGRRFSPFMRNELSKHADRVQEINADAMARLLENQKLKDFLNNASSQDLFDFQKFLESRQSIARFARKTIDGEVSGMSPEGSKAAKEWINESSHQMILMRKNWDSEPMLHARMGRVEKNMAEIQRLKDSGGNVDDAVAKLNFQIKRDLKDAPPVIPYYFKRHVQEIQQGQPLTKWDSRNRSFLNPKDPAAEVNLSKDAEKLREQLLGFVSTLQNEYRGQATEGSWKLFKKAVDQRYGELPAGRMKQAVSEIKELIDTAGIPKEEHFVIRALDFLASSLKQGKLLLPGVAPAHGVRIAMGNYLKGAAVTGIQDSMTVAPSGSLLGTELNFTRDLASNFYSASKPGARSIFDVAFMKPYKEFVTSHLTSPMEKLAQENTMRWAYHRRAKEIMESMPNLTAQEVHRMAYNYAERLGADTFFFTENPAPAYLWAERIIPGSFIRHPVRATIFAMDQAIQHPVAANAVLNLRDTINKNYSIDGRGMLRFKNVEINPTHLSDFNYALQAFENTKPLEAGQTAAETALKFLRAMDSGASAFLKTSAPWEIMQRAINGDDQPVVPEGWKPGNALPQGHPLSPLEEVSKRVFGKTLSDHLLSNLPKGDKESMQARAEQHLRNEQNLIRRAQYAEGDMDPDKADDTFKVQQILSGAGQAFGLPINVRSTAVQSNLRALRDYYYGLPSLQERTDFLNRFYVNTPEGPEPLMRGMVRKPSNIPDKHPNAEFLNEFQKAKNDPQKQIELFNNASLQEKKGVFENLGDQIGNILHKIGEKAADIITGGSEAHGEDLKIPAKLSKEPDKYIEAFKNSYPNMDKQKWIRDVGVLNRDGSGIEWLSDQAHSRGTTGVSNTADQQRVNELERDINTSLRFYLSKAAMSQSTEQYANAFKGPVSVGKDAAGSDIMFDPRPYFGEGSNGRLAKTLINVTGRPVQNPDNPEKTLALNFSNYPGTNEAVAYLTQGKFPTRLVIGDQQRIKQANADLGPWTKRMEEAVKENDSSAASRLESEIYSTKGTKDGPPKDIYRRLMNEGRYDLVTNFALAAKANPDRLSAIYGYLHVDGKLDPNTGDYIPGRYLSENAMDSAAHQGFLPDLQLIGTFDRDVQKYLTQRGWNTDKNFIRQEAFIDFARKNGIELKESDVKDSAGYIPRWALDDVIKITHQGGDVKIESSSGQPKPAERFMGPPPPTPMAPKGDYDFTPGQVRPDLSATLDPLNGMYRSVGQYVTGSIDRTTSANQRIAGLQAQYEQDNNLPTGSAEHMYPRFNLFTTAMHDLPAMDPMTAASGAAGIMALGNRLGFVGDDDMRTISRGLNEAHLQGAGFDVAHGMLAVASHFASGMSMADRAGKVAQEHPNLASFSQYAQPTGELLSFGAGLNSARGGSKEGSMALGAAGGAMQGAALGSYFGPIGMGIGLVAGGVFGAVTASQGAPKQRDESSRIAADHARYLAQLEHQSAFISGSMVSRQRAMNAAFSGGHINPRGPGGFGGMMPQMLNYYRRPSYWTFYGNQGLVRSVESSIFRTLQPRF